MTLNPIWNQDPILTTPTPTPTMTTTTPTPTPKTTPTPTLMMTTTPNLSMIHTSILISTPTLAPTQAQFPIRIPTQPVSYASSTAQIMTSRLTTLTHGLDCAYCGDPRHTRETCFKLHGYPNWWATLTDRGQCNTTSNGTGYGFHTSNKIDFRSWIIDSGATDHMTFDPDDFLNTTQPRRTCIANANGVTYPVIGAGTVALSSSLTLSNTLLDIHTMEILGRGTKRGGLYYVDDFSPCVANSVTHPFDSKQKQIWLWHGRLGHPSFSYMKHLIPDLFLGYFTFVGGNLVTWRSKKQNVVALSSAEAKFRGMTKGICELLWLRKLLTKLGYKPTSTMNLFCDNKAAIAIAQNSV
ncbi:unnamed protein product [Prunus armeniaca]